MATDRTDYHLVLMDSKMLGIDTVKAIRSKGKTMPVPRVTTEGEKHRVVEAIKAGANNFIVKPFGPDTILSKIRDAVDKCKVS